jgi:hypothetical protein
MPNRGANRSRNCVAAPPGALRAAHPNNDGAPSSDDRRVVSGREFFEQAVLLISRNADRGGSVCPRLAFAMQTQ